MATTTEKLIFGVETTALNAVAIASGANALSAAINNLQGGGGTDGYTLCRAKAIIAFTTAAAANTGISVWFLKSSDANLTYEDGATGAGYTPLRLPDLVFPAIPETGVARTISRDILLPANFFKVLVRNPIETGQAITSLTLTITPIARQSV